MLEEMRRAVCLVRLRSATSIDPDTDGARLRPWRVLSGDGEAIGQRRRLCPGAVAHGGSEALLGADGIDGRTASQGLLKVQRKPS